MTTESALTTCTRTALFTDLADYTARVSHADREGLRNILLEHEALVRPIVERNNGRVVKNIGDSFLCLFPAATEALRAALEILRPREDAPDAPLRMGMNTGDIEEIDGDAFGEPVNIASRILQKAPAGEAWFGLGTRVAMNDAEIPWQGVGRLHLRGIPGEQECFRLVPEHRAWLPYAVERAITTRRLARVIAGSPVPELPPDPVVLFEGFEPGSEALEDVIATLPILDPASMFLAAYRLATDDRHAWSESGHGFVIGTPEAIEEAIRRVQEPERARRRAAAGDDAETLALDPHLLPLLDLVVCGLALPEVPFSDVVASYSYEMLPDGSWVTSSEDSVLRVEVLPEEVLLHALAPGVSVNGRLAPESRPEPLEDPAMVSTPSGILRYHALHGDYRGVLLSDSRLKLGVMNGQTAEFGRRPNPPGLAFPARDGQENIRWCSGARAARARENGFTLDRVLAGRRQGAIRAKGSDVELLPLHDECPTYLLRDGTLERTEEPVRVQIGDMVLAGTTVLALRMPG